MSTPTNDFRIRLELEGSPDLDTVEGTTRDLKLVLREIEERLTNKPAKISWRWTDDAEVVAIATANGVSPRVLQQIVDETKLGFKRLKESRGNRIEWPQTFTTKAKGAVTRIVKRLAPHDVAEKAGELPAGQLETIGVYVQDDEALVIDHVVLPDERGIGQTRSEHASIDGVLDLISVRGGGYKFEITEHGTDRKITCVVNEAQFEKAKKAIGQRVVADGVLRYRRDTPRVLSEIVSIWVRPKAVPVESLRGSIPKLTEGKSAEDYVRDLRGEYEDDERDGDPRSHK